MEIYQTSFLPNQSPKPNFTEITHDLASKLNLHHPHVEDPSPLSEDHLKEHQPQLQGNDAGEQEVKEEKEEEEEEEVREEEEEEEEEEDDDDFSFCCGRPDGSPVSAEDIFADGIIRPVFPLFNQSLLLRGEPGAIYPLQPPLKRLFAEEAGKFPRVVKEIELPSPGSCKKSNSTGSSKLCQFVDTVVPRSSSDGKDAFVFLRKDKDDAVLKAKKDKGVMVAEGKEKGKGRGRKPLPSAAGKGKATEKHKSYLPYRRDLLGFFTNSNLLSKNVHPF